MKSKIMVVDDEMHIRELVRFYLDKAGFDTIEAANACLLYTSDAADESTAV